MAEQQEKQTRQCEINKNRKKIKGSGFSAFQANKVKSKLYNYYLSNTLPTQTWYPCQMQCIALVQADQSLLVKENKIRVVQN